jgi:predicted membrane protein
MLDAVATIILAGMMFMPIINLVVGIIVGACCFGFSGAIAGAALAFLITIAQKQVPWRRPIHIKLGTRIIDFPSRPTAAAL